MTVEPNYLAQCLEQTLNAATRKLGEQAIQQAEKQPQYALHVLQLVESAQLTMPVRTAAAIAFKNYVKRNWSPDEDVHLLSESDRDVLKARIVGLMISLPDKLQSIVSEAVAFMADHDFPARWPTLVQDLVSRLSPADYEVNAGVLQTAHSIFKRYRFLMRSDDLFREINMVMEQFSPAFLELFKNTDALIEQHATNTHALKVLFNSLHLMCKIFYSLNYQDIPAFFEDNLATFMPLFLKYLTYNNPNAQTDDNDEAGHLEKVKTSVCEIVDLYTKKYEDVYAEYLPKFVETIWALLTNTGQQTKNDMLVSTAISFLSSVAKLERHRAMFEAPGALESICEKIILPNMQLRESDEELFEDDPIEYIRRDLEGSDNDTRRRAATDLVRSLAEQFEARLTGLFGGYVNHFLQNYQASPAKNWKDKDTAIYLLIAITARAATSQLGATKTNENINIVDIFSNHILADLQSAPDLSTPHPVVRVDALKFLNTFRHQLTKEQLISVFPLIVAHLTSPNYVVHTYAAVCVERILFMKQGPLLIFSAADLKPFTEALLVNLFQLIESGQTPEKISENDYLMKTIMRVIYISRQDMAPYAKMVLERLVKILEVISKNPSNPKFNHYVFEAIGSLVRFLCSANRGFVSEFETMLFPTIQAIVQLDIPEFIPYVLQIMSQLLELNEGPGIPGPYLAFLPPILQPPLWEMHGNIPALVRLLQAYLTHGANEILNANQLPAFLGIFQKLIASRANDQYGFDLLVSIFSHVPIDKLQPFLKQVFNILLLRLQSSKTAKYTQGFLKLICTVACLSRHIPNSALIVVETMDSIQPKLFGMVSQSVLLPEMKNVSGGFDRKTTIVALARFVAECPSLWDPSFAPLIAAFINEGARIANTPLVKDAPVDEDEFMAMDAEDTGYQSVFVRLHSVAKAAFDPASDVGNPDEFFKSTIMSVAPKIQMALGQLQPDTKQYLGL